MPSRALQVPARLCWLPRHTMNTLRLSHLVRIMTAAGKFHDRSCHGEKTDIAVLVVCFFFFCRSLSKMVSDPRLHDREF